MASEATKTTELPENAARHCLDALPYRMIVFDRFNGQIPLYLVAGSSAGAAGAKKALRTAYDRHGGACFYCDEKPDEMTIDHVEPLKQGGSSSLQNLVISCKPCNARKGESTIEAYKPEAGKEWLSALLAQVQTRLSRLD